MTISESALNLLTETGSIDYSFYTAVSLTGDAGIDNNASKELLIGAGNNIAFMVTDASSAFSPDAKKSHQALG